MESEQEEMVSQPGVKEFKEIPVQYRELYPIIGLVAVVFVVLCVMIFYYNRALIEARGYVDEQHQSVLSLLETNHSLKVTTEKLQKEKDAQDELITVLYTERTQIQELLKTIKPRPFLHLDTTTLKVYACQDSKCKVLN